MNNTTRNIIYIIIALLVIGGVVYAVTHNKNKKSAKDYSLSEIKQLSPEEQKKILENQVMQFQSEAKALTKGTGDNAQKEYDIAKSRIYIKLAQALNELQRYQEAVDALNNIPDSQKNNPPVYEAYVTAYKGLNQLDKAKEMAKKAIDEGANSPQVWLLYLDVNKDLPAAQVDALYNQALKATTNNLDVVIAYARYLESVGNKTKAIVYWETARNINPDGAADYEKEIARLRQ